MRKLSRTVENSILSMTENGFSSRVIAKEIKVSQLVVIRILKRRNITPQAQVIGRRKLLTDGDASLMMRKMKAEQSLTPKEAFLAINKNNGR